MGVAGVTKRAPAAQAEAFAPFWAYSGIYWGYGVAI